MKKINPFITFVTVNSSNTESLTTITKDTNTRFHYNKITTDNDTKYDGFKRVNARHSVGICNKI